MLEWIAWYCFSRPVLAAGFRPASLGNFCSFDMVLVDSLLGGLDPDRRVDTFTMGLFRELSRCHSGLIRRVDSLSDRVGLNGRLCFRRLSKRRNMPEQRCAFP